MGVAIFCTAAAPTAAIDLDHRTIDIPAAYRGLWAVDAVMCKHVDLGPAFVQIEARRISFYEDFGYLRLAQLNEGEDPPEFFGQFDFVNNLKFYGDVVRLDMEGGKLFITRHAKVGTDHDRLDWVRCPTSGKTDQAK